MRAWTVWIVAGVLLAAGAAGARERLSLDRGWRFHLGEVEGAVPVATGHAIEHWRWRPAEPGEDPAAVGVLGVAERGEWHDAVPGQDVFHGRLGFAWFRTLLPAAPGPHPELAFDGVDDNATIYLNGVRLLHHLGWNEAFVVPLATAWRGGGPNVLAVLVENTDGPGGVGKAWLRDPAAEVPAGSAASPSFTDAAWRAVDVPHDYVVETPFSPQADASHGFHPTGIGWYRRAFSLPASDRGRRVWLEFDGVYRNSTAWLNGHRLGIHPSGYTSFRYEVTDLLNYGGRNLLAVRTDASGHEGWWYEGGGIYRHVWLLKTAPVHVVPWGVYVTSTLPDGALGDRADATVNVEATLRNAAAPAVEATVHTELLDPEGKSVATADRPVALDPAKGTTVTALLPVRGARLWSLAHPNLYRAVTSLRVDGREVDRVETPFGLRTIRFDPDHGFFLNGAPVKIQGTCNHQDFAGVGVALPDRLQVYKLERLKAIGANGYRCSHHPPAPELLDACDRLGILVMDENRKLGDSPEIQGQVESMVLRDRNHPSIVLWSLCNEEWKYQATPEGERMGNVLKEIIRRLDPTRPITAAMNGGYGAGLTHVVDVQGFNYHPGEYGSFHKQFPTLPVIGSESASALYTRGIYESDAVRGYVTAYNSAEFAWRPVGEREYLAGSFVWTGFDYRGEPSPYAWPCVNSHFGILDTCGFPKDDAGYYRAWWGTKPVVHLRPHWNWAYNKTGADAPKITVRADSNAERVELFLNGASLGAQPVPRLGHVEWQVPWHPGKLTAKGYRGAEVVATDEVETAGEPAALKLEADRVTLDANGEDVAVVAVSVLDDHGRLVPTADNDVQFASTGNGRILGVGNGDPSSHEPDKADRRRAFGGHCLVLVQTTDRPGPLTLTATSPGLATATVTLTAQPAARRPAVP